MHWHGPSNEMHPQLQPQKTKVMLYWLLIYVRSNKRHYKRCTLLTRQSAALAINMMHGSGPNNKMRPQLQPNKTKVKAALAIYKEVKGFIRNVHY